ASRHARRVRRHAGQGEGGQVRLPGDQRDVIADTSRGDAGLRGGRERRHRAGVHRRGGVPVRSHGQGHGHRGDVAGSVRGRGGEEVLGQHRAAHRPLPEGQARRLRPALAGGFEGTGGGRWVAAVPVAHVGRLGRSPGGEPVDRQGAPRRGRTGQDRARDRGRCGGRRGGRSRRSDGRQALHHPGRRGTNGAGSRPRRARPLPGGADVRQRARRLQAGQRQAASGDPQGGAGGRRQGARAGRRCQAVPPGLPRRFRVDLGGDPDGARLRRGQDERRHRHAVRLHPADRRPHVHQLLRRAQGGRRGGLEEGVRPPVVRQGGRSRDGRTCRGGVREPALRWHLVDVL
ncbi:MAG: Fructose-bisphosphate aldolase class II, partial [uncultured Nocardioidaceae bacterium]